MERRKEYQYWNHHWYDTDKNQVWETSSAQSPHWSKWESEDRSPHWSKRESEDQSVPAKKTPRGPPFAQVQSGTNEEEVEESEFHYLLDIVLVMYQIWWWSFGWSEWNEWSFSFFLLEGFGLVVGSSFLWRSEKEQKKEKVLVYVEDNRRFLAWFGDGRQSLFQCWIVAGYNLTNSQS